MYDSFLWLHILIFRVNLQYITRSIYILVDCLIAHITIYIQECQKHWDRTTSITITVIKSRTVCSGDEIWKLVIRWEINDSNIWIRSELISTNLRQRILLEMNLNLRLHLTLRKKLTSSRYAFDRKRYLGSSVIWFRPNSTKSSSLLFLKRSSGTFVI